MKNYAIIDGLTKDANDKIHTIFDKGYKQGYEDGIMQAQNARASLIDANYTQGLKDAWECARKIVSCNGFDLIAVTKIFGTSMIGEIFEHETPSEAIAKIKTFEEEQSTRKCVNCRHQTGSPSSICDSCVSGSRFKPQDIIKVGDEIWSESIKTSAVVLFIEPQGLYQCFDSRGSSFTLDIVTYNKYWKKTGRNFSQVDEILGLLKEGSDK